MTRLKKSEKYFDEEYNNICVQLYNDYMIGFKKRLTADGVGHLLLTNNGCIEKIFCTYVKDIFNKYENSIIEIFDNIRNEFETSFSEKFLQKLEVKNNDIIDGHLNNIIQKIENLIGRELSETIKSNIINIGQNAKTNTIYNIRKKNNSIKRLLKKEKRKIGILNIIKNSLVENIVGYFTSFLLGIFIGNLDYIFDLLKNLVNK